MLAVCDMKTNKHRNMRKHYTVNDCASRMFMRSGVVYTPITGRCLPDGVYHGTRSVATIN